MIDRRGAIGAIGGGLALAAAPSASAASLKLDTAESRMRTFMLMRGALDEQLVIGWVNGRYWGCVSGETIPLFDVTSVTFSRFRKLPDGGYRSVSVEQAYFLDVRTGERIETLVNPYTGKTVKVPTGGYPPTASAFTAERELKVTPPPGAVFKHVATPFVVQGNDVMMTEITTMSIPSRTGGGPTLFHEVTGFSARLDELTRPGATRVPCITNYTSIKSWRSWLEMGDHPGETVTTGQGRVGATIATLPAPWLAAARRDRPDLLADPAKVLEPVWLAG